MSETDIIESETDIIEPNISSPTKLTIMSYNILDIELESNFVPRNMDQSSKDDILAATGKTDPKEKADYWNQTFVEAYRPFHSGYGTKTKSETRKLWSDLSANTDTITVIDEKTSESRKIDCKNLMQILNEQFGNEKASELYNKIKEINYPWVENRLDRVFKKIVEKMPDIVCLQEYGNGKNKPENDDAPNTEINDKFKNATKSTFAEEDNINIDALAEQKVKPNSLADKLKGKGYDYKLYSYNPVKTNGDDGLAIFYKRDMFEDEPIKTYVDMDEKVRTEYSVAKYGKNAYTTQRGCALLGLTLKEGGQKVYIYTTHIQTASNEKIKEDQYAIRRGELNYIKDHIVNANYAQNDIVVFCGDFNLDLNKDDKTVIDEFETGNTLRRHKINKNDDDVGFVTSYPNGRKEYIDYIFSNREGDLSGNYIKLSELNGKTIPNADTEPSDHIPILLTIPLGATQETTGGKTRKRRKQKKSNISKKSKQKKSNISKKSKQKKSNPSKKSNKRK